MLIAAAINAALDPSSALDERLERAQAQLRRSVDATRLHVLEAAQRMRPDFVLSRSLPLVTLLHSANAGPTQRMRRLLSKQELHGWLGPNAEEFALDLERFSICAVSLGRSSRRAALIRVRSVIVCSLRTRPPRAFIHVEETSAPAGIGSIGLAGGVHVVACERLPEQVTFVECPALSSDRKGRSSDALKRAPAVVLPPSTARLGLAPEPNNER